MNKRFYSFLFAVIGLMFSASAFAQDELIWDYTETAPSANPDNGLTYASKVNDATGTKNGLKGIKMNSSGYCYFTKNAVEGTLKLTFGPRDGSKESALDVFTYAETPGAETLVATTPLVTECQTVSIELTAEQNNIYIQRNTANEQVLCKIQFSPKVARTFKDFEINLVNLSAPFDTTTLPEGVVMEGSNRGDSHGYDNFKLTIPVDGPVKFTIGGCQYSKTQGTFVNSKGETIGSVDVTSGCYHNGAIVEYVYTGGKDVLTYNGAEYSPYFKAEAVEITPCVVTFKDQNGNVIGKVDANEGDALGEIPYSEKDLTYSKSEVFRGWVYASGVKAKATDLLTGNTTISALVTPFEYVTVGSVQNYKLTSNIFYPEDHETINIEGGYYHESQHGWAIANDGKVSVQVAGNAQVVLGLCVYSKNAPITCTDAAGNVVKTIESGYVETDGTTAVVNYEGEATTLTFTFAQGESYLHSVVVYNVKDFVKKDESTGYYIIPKGDGAALLLALNSANSEEGAKLFLQDGVYDLGETVGTAVSGKNLSIIGQSSKAIIKNAPSVKVEGLGSADLLYNTAEGLYMQNLTLQNALDYYAAGSAGRACAFHDKGNMTACYDVVLDSYQDTYYSHRDGAYFYWEKGAIMGTVDYMCGGGNVYYNGITIKNRSREASGSKGDCTINAPYTAAADKGYVYESCVIETESQTFNLGRSWADAKCAYLNTTIKSGKLADSRWTLKGMNSSAVSFKEYKTKDETGNTTCPSTYVATFTHSKGDLTYETILSDEEAKAYSYESFFADSNWDPKSLTAQVEAKVASASATQLTMAEEGTYLVECGSEYVALFVGTTFSNEFDAAKTYTVRKANARGGFGEPTAIDFTSTGIKSVDNADAPATVYDLNGRKLSTAKKGVNIVGGKKVYNK